MSMLHPRFNHLGRSKKRRPSKHKLALLREAQAEHEMFLFRYGLKPIGKRHRLRGAVELDNAAYNPRQPNLAPTSDLIDQPALMDPDLTLELTNTDLIVDTLHKQGPMVLSRSELPWAGGRKP